MHTRIKILTSWKRLSVAGCLRPRSSTRFITSTKNKDLKVEDLLMKINLTLKAREQMQAEMQELELKRDTVEKELHELCAERKNLQEDLEKKQETVQVLKLRRDSCQNKEDRQREQAEDYKKRTATLRTQILEEKLKQRKQRMEFQDQLDDLMTKHKNLAEFNNPMRLEAEISVLEEQKKELIKEEREKQCKLKEVEETEARLIEQGMLTPENIFLHSEEAACTVKMFEEENAFAKTLLEKAKARHAELLENYNRLKAKLKAAELKLSKTPGAMSGEISQSYSAHFSFNE